MTREEWLQRYKARMKARADITDEQADVCAEAESFETLSEFFDDPEGAADEELSWWTE